MRACLKRKKWAFFLCSKWVYIIFVQKGTKIKEWLSEYWTWHKTIFPPLFFWILQGKRVAQWGEERIYSDSQAKVWTLVETFDSLKASLTLNVNHSPLKGCSVGLLVHLRKVFAPNKKFINLFLRVKSLKNKITKFDIIFT